MPYDNWAMQNAPGACDSQTRSPPQQGLWWCVLLGLLVFAGTAGAVQVTDGKIVHCRAKVYEAEMEPRQPAIGIDLGRLVLPEQEIFGLHVPAPRAAAHSGSVNGCRNEKWLGGAQAPVCDVGGVQCLKCEEQLPKEIAQDIIPLRGHRVKMLAHSVQPGRAGTAGGRRIPLGWSVARSTTETLAAAPPGCLGSWRTHSWMLHCT